MKEFDGAGGCAVKASTAVLTYASTVRNKSIKHLNFLMWNDGDLGVVGGMNPENEWKNVVDGVMFYVDLALVWAWRVVCRVAVALGFIVVKRAPNLL